EDAARPYPFRVRASALAIPVTGKKHTGLRARIAGCVELSSGTDDKSAYVSVWVNPRRMLPDYRTLPLYMQGGKLGSRGGDHARWRHRVYGHRDRPWVQQPARPFFYQAAEPLGRAAAPAIEAALGDITRKLNGLPAAWWTGTPSPRPRSSR